ncbi:unnamed protein product [Danaus chrysippus]|uniref:Phospholipase A2 n=1 Tax=Danaus chrysippus TaxID=151541 RepID=A0A8J2QC83_9NEOP|nr:unnamed protein product [Danaus chrysippus]
MCSKLAVLVVLAVCQCGLAWIFNNIDYRMLEKSLLEEMEASEEDYDLTPEELARLRFSLIYPGTKWCGPGNIADNYDDLGTSKEADYCCRNHDNCPDSIPAGETRFNLTNDAYYTRLSCECDESFRQCLRNTTTRSAKAIGLMYFNVIGTQCFRDDYPVTGCKRKGGDKKSISFNDFEQIQGLQF